MTYGIRYTVYGIRYGIRYTVHDMCICRMPHAFICLNGLNCATRRYDI